MPPFTESTTSSTASYATGGYIAYTPISTTTTGTIYTTYNASEEKMKEYAEKVDKHIDQLEEDIEYFNNKLEDNTSIIGGHEARLINESNKNIDQDTKIKALEDAVEFLKNYTNYLEGRIMVLEDKVNDKMS